MPILLCLFALSSIIQLVELLVSLFAVRALCIGITPAVLLPNLGRGSLNVPRRPFKQGNWRVADCYTRNFFDGGDVHFCLRFADKENILQRQATQGSGAPLLL